MKIVLLWTDIFLWFIVFISIFVIYKISKRHDYRHIFKQLFSSKLAILSCIILIFYISIALLDSIHYRSHFAHNLSDQHEHITNNSISSTDNYYGDVESLLDHILLPWSEYAEITFSKPFASYSFVKESIVKNNKIIRDYPRLEHNIKKDSLNIILLKILFIIIINIIIFFMIYKFINYKMDYQNINKHNNFNFILFIICIIFTLLLISLYLFKQYHILGTDKIGQDIFYMSIKSIRTGVSIGLLTTLFMLPFAILFGTIAGYYGGVIDDIVQYIYTTLSSIPGVLLIAAFILIIQSQIALNPGWFETVAQKADIRLLSLCMILGITSWSGLCRLIRAETMKIKNLDYVLAAKTMKSKDHKIILKHIIPNLLHIIIINISISFSGLVLAEAVLSYIGVGVDPTMYSWGNMINAARQELARDPIVWWPLLSAFMFMSIFVLALNLFANKLQDAFDPRTRIQ